MSPSKGRASGGKNAAIEALKCYNKKFTNEDSYSFRQWTKQVQLNNLYK